MDLRRDSEGAFSQSYTGSTLEYPHCSSTRKLVEGPMQRTVDKGSSPISMLTWRCVSRGSRPENGGLEAALKYIDSVPFDVVVKALTSQLVCRKLGRGDLGIRPDSQGCIQ